LSILFLKQIKVDSILDFYLGLISAIVIRIGSTCWMHQIYSLSNLSFEIIESNGIELAVDCSMAFCFQVMKRD